MSYDHIKWEIQQSNSLCLSNRKELPPEVKKEFETDEWWKKRNIGQDDPGF